MEESQSEIEAPVKPFYIILDKEEISNQEKVEKQKKQKNELLLYVQLLFNDYLFSKGNPYVLPCKQKKVLLKICYPMLYSLLFLSLIHSLCARSYIVICMLHIYKTKFWRSNQYLRVLSIFIDKLDQNLQKLRKEGIVRMGLNYLGLGNSLVQIKVAFVLIYRQVLKHVILLVQRYIIKNIQNITLSMGYNFVRKRLMIKAITSEQEGTNIIRFGDKKIKFEHNSYEDSNEMEFYGLHISPDYPCLNPHHAPNQRSNLSYPFSQIPHTGCKDYGNHKKEATLLDSIFQGQLLAENNILFTQFDLPYFDTYIRQDDIQNLYLMRKIYMDKHKQCQNALVYPFQHMYYSCLLIQVITVLVCFFAFSSFFISAFLGFWAFFIYFILRQKVKSNIAYTYKDKYKWNLNQVILKSVIIMSFINVVAILIGKIVLLFGENNKNGLENSEAFIQLVLRIPCFTHKSMNRIFLSLLHISQTCGTSISPLISAILYGQIAYSILFFIVVYLGKNKPTIFQHDKED